MISSTSFQRVWTWYSRMPVQKAIVDIAKNREVVSVYKDEKFGKRPNILQFPQDVLQEVAEGTVAFHGSVERWQQPMNLDVGLTKPAMDELRIGWDVFIDPDVKDFDIGKIVTKQIIEAFKDHGVRSYSIKYTGGKGFHIGIPVEALPEKINMQPTAKLYPETLHKVVEYLKSYTAEQLREALLAFDTPQNIAQRVEKPLDDIVSKEGLDPFKIVSMDLFGSRHLFRLPYSLNEKSLLVSLPIKPEELESFEKEQAQPEKVKIENSFLSPASGTGDAEILVIEAMDWAAKHQVEIKEELPIARKFERVKVFEEKYFPPCMHNILKGLADGRKRSVFVLINFLKNMGWDEQKMSDALDKWNEKNYPPLRANYLRGQLRWHLRQDRNLLPPNCDNQNFYVNYKVCDPDKVCMAGTDKIVLKNPVNYPFKLLSREQRKLEKKKPAK